MFIKQFNTKSEFDNYIQGNATIGRYFIVSDENNNNKPTEYYWDGINVNFIGGNENYKIVDTIEDRDNISIDNLNDGILVYVINEKIEYKLENGQWTINDIVYNKDVTDSIKTYYVDSINGSDIIGDGTELNPWQSLEKCLSTIPSNLVHRTNIQLGEGIYDWTAKCNSLLQNFILNEQLRIYGKTELIRSDFTTVGGVVNPNNAFEKTVVGATWNDDEYFGKLIGGTSLDNLSTCSYHSTNSLSTPRIKEGTNFTHLYDKLSTIILETGVIFNTLIGNTALQFRNLNVNTIASRLELCSGNVRLRLMSCEIKLDNKLLQGYGTIEILDSLVTSENTTYAIRIRDTDLFEFRNTQLIDIGGSNGNTAIHIQSKRLLFFNSEITNYNTAFLISSTSQVIPSWGDSSTRSILFKNIGTIFNVFSNNFKLDFFNSEIYLNNVNYAVNLNNLSYNNINIDLRGRIASGDFNLGVFEGTPPPKLVDPSKNFSIQYDGSETFESEYIHYRIVDTIEDRDNIPENERVDGMVVYVSLIQTEYRLSGGISNSHWTLEQFIYNESSTTESKTYYVDNTGSDETGDGTELNPWKTLNKALITIPSNIVPGNLIKIQLGEGSYSVSDKDSILLSKFNLGGSLQILGKLEEVVSGITVDTDPTNIFKSIITSGQVFTENQHFGYLTKSGLSYYPITNHGTQDLVSTINTGINSIHELKTELTFESGKLYPLNGTTQLRFQHLKLVNLKEVRCGNNVKLVFWESCFSNVSSHLSISSETLFRRVLFSGETIIGSGVLLTSQASCIFDIESSIFEIKESSNNTSARMIRSVSSILRFFGNNLIQNGGYAISTIGNLGDIILDHNAVVGVVKCTSIMDYWGPSKLSLGNNSKFIIDNTNYGFTFRNYQTGIDCRLNNSIDGSPLIGWIDPNNSVPAKLVDVDKGLFITYTGSETFESEYIHYRIVNDITERDNILYNEKTEGMLVYTISGDTEYRWIDNEWSINSTNSGLSDSYWSGVTGTDDIYYNNGKVGINTSVATATLDINGNIRIRQGAAEGRVLTCDNSGLASWQTISGTTIGTTTLRNLDDVSPDGSNDDGKALVWNSIDNTHYYVNFPEDNGSSGGFLGGVTQSTSQPIELKQNQWVQPLPTNTYDIEYTFDNFKDQSNASIYVNLSTEDVKLRYIEDNGGYWEKVSFIKPLTEGKTWIGNSFNQAEEYDTLLEWVGTESELTGIGQKYSLETQNYYVVAHDTIRIGKNIITKTINLKDVSNIKILNNVSGKSLLTTNILLRIKQDINEQFTFSIGSYSSSYNNIVNTTSISNSNNNQIYPLILPITISQIGLPSSELKITTGDVYFKITQPTTNDMFVDIIYDAVWI